MVLLFYLCDIFIYKCQYLFQDKIAKFGNSDFLNKKENRTCGSVTHLQIHIYINMCKLQNLIFFMRIFLIGC